MNLLFDKIKDWNFETGMTALWAAHRRSYWIEIATQCRVSAASSDSATVLNSTSDALACQMLAERMRKEVADSSPAQRRDLYQDSRLTAIHKVKWDELARHYLDQAN